MVTIFQLAQANNQRLLAGFNTADLMVTFSSTVLVVAFKLFGEFHPCSLDQSLIRSGWANLRQERYLGTDCGRSHLRIGVITSTTGRDKGSECSPGRAFITKEGVSCVRYSQL